MNGRQPALAAAVILALTPLAGCIHGADRPPSQLGTAPSPRAEEYLDLPVEPVDDVADLALPFPGLLVVGSSPNRVWLGAPEGLAWIDLHRASSHVVDRIPGAYVALVGDDTLYRAGYEAQTIARYDVSGQPREVARGTVHWPLGIAADRNVLWVTDHEHSELLRLDPDDLTVTRSIQIGEEDSDINGAAGLAWVGNDLWVVSKWDASLYQVDGRTGDVQRVVPLDAEDVADPIVSTSAGLWVWVGDRLEDGVAYHSLVLVDPDRGEVTTRLRLRKPADMDAVQAAQVSTPIDVAGEIWAPVDRYLVHLNADHDWAPDRVLGLPDQTVLFSTVVAGDYLWYYSPSPAPHDARIPLEALAMSD